MKTPLLLESGVITCGDVPPSPHVHAPLREIGITRRECEVITWLMEGKRNAEIAVILGISAGTVKIHVEHILAKLGVETRSAAAARAHKLLR